MPYVIILIFCFRWTGIMAIWLALFFTFFADTPEQCRWISNAELQYLRNDAMLITDSTGSLSSLSSLTLFSPFTKLRSQSAYTLVIDIHLPGCLRICHCSVYFPLWKLFHRYFFAYLSKGSLRCHCRQQWSVH